MNWQGKADRFRTIQMPSLWTLRSCPEESVNFDATEPCRPTLNRPGRRPLPFPSG